MIAILLAAGSALVWGIGDFCGGKATQRAPALAVAVVSKLASLPVLALYLVLQPATPRPAGLTWAVGAGMIGMVGLIIFYRALASGAMIVVAPISAVTTAVVPMAVGLLSEQLPPRTALIGAVCAVVAIALVSAVRRNGPVMVTPALVGWSLAAGTAFGLFFVFLDAAGAAAGADIGLWPIAAAQAGAIVLGAVLLALTRTAPRLAPTELRWAVVAGVLDMTANALYLLAVQQGLLSIVAPLAALYPASTVLLARLVDREPIGRIQLAGLGLAAVALVLVAS